MQTKLHLYVQKTHFFSFKLHFSVENIDQTFLLSDTVTFDNTYSMFKNKKIKYSVYMTEPITKLDMSVLPANEE